MAILITRGLREFDVAELTEDLPQYRLKRGQRGTVVMAFGPDEEHYSEFVLSFVDESGKSVFAYGVRGSD